MYNEAFEDKNQEGRIHDENTLSNVWYIFLIKTEIKKYSHVM